ncbi:MAG: hypothetical protein J6R79_02335 [Bacteroidaceae bacterium]|nr:hypothetical protein [Bacteroidaceae bacterium]
MLYRIKYICDEVDGFVREIKIDSDSTFLDLCKVILKSCNYPDDQMTEFFVCDDEWERHEQITREDMGNDDIDTDVFLMEKTPLGDFIEDEGQHFEFVFDPFAERSFFLDVKELIPGEHLDEPVIIRSKGDAPQQLQNFDDPFADAIVAKTNKGFGGGSDDYDDDFLYSGEGGLFNDDELDLEGFEISDGNPY